jgi:hypothetical protein
MGLSIVRSSAANPCSIHIVKNYIFGRAYGEVSIMGPIAQAEARRNVQASDNNDKPGSNSHEPPTL